MALPIWCGVRRTKKGWSGGFAHGLVEPRSPAQVIGRAASARRERRSPVGSRRVVSTIRSLRSLLDHLVVGGRWQRPPTGWSSSERQRAISRSTTAWTRRTPLAQARPPVVVDRTHRWSIDHASDDQPVGSRRVVRLRASLRSTTVRSVVDGQRPPTGRSSSERQRAISRQSTHGAWSRLSARFARLLDHLAVGGRWQRPPTGGRAASASERSVETTRPTYDAPRLAIRRVVSTIRSLRSLLDHLVVDGARRARPPVPSYARARWRATMPPDRLRHSVAVQPAWPIRVARPRWSGQARMDSAR